MYIDTHAHIDFPDFDNDRSEVVKNAAKGGVSFIINAGTDIKSSRFSLDLARKETCIKAVVGIHPSGVLNAGPGSMLEIEKLAMDEEAVGIGETGLDFFYGRESALKQKEFFISHIRVARKLNKPLVVHQRECREEIMEIIDKEKMPEKVVFHCFGEDAVLADYCRQKGFYISFSGIITFKKAEGVRRVCSGYPVEKIMAETDSPYLSPVPFRGKRNEPARVRRVVDEISNIKSGFPDCRERIYLNSKTFFNIF